MVIGSDPSSSYSNFFCLLISQYIPPEYLIDIQLFNCQLPFDFQLMTNY